MQKTVHQATVMLAGFLARSAFVASGAWPVMAQAQQFATQAAVPPVRIVAWARHEGCHVRYTYVVQNNGTQPVRRMLIGLYQPDTGVGTADLNLLPQLNGKALWLAPEMARSPGGWHVKAYFPEDSKKFALEWISAKYHADLWPKSPAVPLPALVTVTDNPVLPGTSARNFSVLLAQADHAYATARANLDYGDASLNVQIEKGDVTPPTLNLAVSQVRAGARDEWAAFDVSVSMADNFDGAPDMATPTARANQSMPARDFVAQAKPNGWRLYFRNVAGRVYQAQFVATDASGNATSRTLDYAVKVPTRFW